MAVADRITMTMRELDRFKVIQSVVDGQLKPWRAAERLGVSRRQATPEPLPCGKKRLRVHPVQTIRSATAVFANNRY